MNVAAEPMRVLMISKALVTGVYQRKVEELAAHSDLELRVVVPPFWREMRVGDQPLERLFTSGYDLIEEPMRFNGRHHVHYYPGIARQVQSFRPDIVHIDEEPYNLVTAHITRIALKNDARTIFFTWQNLLRAYPPPFRWIEQYCYRSASHALAGNRDARRILYQKGYRGPVSVIPQFGIDPDIYQSKRSTMRSNDVPVIGFVGRIVPEKGLDTLLDAVAGLDGRVEVHIIGSGTAQPELEAQASRLGIGDAVRFPGPVPPAEVPDLLASFDALVLPSRTRPNWKEQFGRILIEAMACETPVVGSDSGEIPHVIGDAGLTFPEGNAETLRIQLKKILNDSEYARELGQKGRQRVLERFTQKQIAEQTYDVYRSVAGQSEWRGASG